MLETADARRTRRRKGPARTGLWQVLAGGRPGDYVSLFRSGGAEGILPGAGPVRLRELLRPAAFSPLR